MSQARLIRCTLIKSNGLDVCLQNPTVGEKELLSMRGELRSGCEKARLLRVSFISTRLQNQEFFRMIVLYCCAVVWDVLPIVFTTMR